MKMNNQKVIDAISNDEVGEIIISIGKRYVSFPIDSLKCSKSILHSIKTELIAVELNK